MNSHQPGPAAITRSDADSPVEHPDDTGDRLDEDLPAR